MKNKQLIYQVFVRNASKEGNFEYIRKNLDRLQVLGVDVLYLMPIQPIGEKARKGTYGSPYAIKDYFGIEPTLGTLEDFRSLLNDAHAKGMKVILDMVFHHTSPDNELFKIHPEYYYLKDGKPGNRVGDWSDVIDLLTERPDVQEYLLSVLQFWVDLGVDGFRFDVASMIALSFFKMARNALGKDVIFFAESVDTDFANYLATTDTPSIPDDDMYPTFDYLYNYNYYRILERQTKEGGHAYELAEAISKELNFTPMHCRVHCLENHDVERFAKRVIDPEKRASWIRLTSRLYGHLFLYMGQEFGNNTDVPLFEKQPVDWSYVDEDLARLYVEVIAEAKSLPPIDRQSIHAVDGNTLALSTEFADGSKLDEVFKL